MSTPAGEARDEPGEHAEQGGLPDAGAAGDEDQLALLEGEVDVAEHLVLVVAEADVPQLDHRPHAVASSGVSALAGTGVVKAGTVPRTPTTSARGERYGITSTPG